VTNQETGYENRHGKWAHLPVKKVLVLGSRGFRRFRSFYLLTYLNLPLSYAPVDGGQGLGGAAR
jgi:hypothetical protein